MIVHETNTKMADVLLARNAKNSPIVLLKTPVANNSPIVTDRRKHRYTLFIGYGEESGSLLKRCEQLKCKLGINTNIQFLNYLIEFFEDKNPEFRLSDQDGLTAFSKNRPKNVKKFQDNDMTKEMDCGFVEQQNQDREEEEAQIADVPLFYSNKYNKKLDITQPTDSQSSMNISVSDIGMKRLLPKEISDEERLKVKKITDAEALSTTTTELESPSEQLLNDHTATLSSAALSSATTLKAVKIICQHMENIKRDLNYYHGFISSTEKLRMFLDEYRQATNTSFTVRSSRSYIKKRALNAVKALKSETEEQNDLSIGATQILDCDMKEEEKEVLQQTMCNKTLINIENEKMTTPSMESMEKSFHNNTVDSTTTSESTQILDREAANEDIVVDQNGKENSPEELELLDDSIVTGPLRWEYILGKPPIPFTGVPFFIIGNTQYQCFYATADTRTQKRRSEVEKMGNPTIKPRLRRSLKRDCKAVMCIKSIVSFPEFTIQETIRPIKSKKACRKLKAKTLEKVRSAVEKGETIGHPAFWVYIPLPDAHTTHDLEAETDKVVNLENMDEIAHILNAAAQYGGQVKVVQRSGDVVEFQINDVPNDLGGDVTQLSASQFLYFNEQCSEETVQDT